jgi:hypothetical protein
VVEPSRGSIVPPGTSLHIGDQHQRVSGRHHSGSQQGGAYQRPRLATSHQPAKERQPRLLPFCLRNRSILPQDTPLGDRQAQMPPVHAVVRKVHASQTKRERVGRQRLLSSGVSGRQKPNAVLVWLSRSARQSLASCDPPGGIGTNRKGDCKWGLPVGQKTLPVSTRTGLFPTSTILPDSDCRLPVRSRRSVYCSGTW